VLLLGAVQETINGKMRNKTKQMTGNFFNIFLTPMVRFDFAH